MGIIKRGKYYWIDVRIKGKRIRRSLNTTNKPVALLRFSEQREELLAESEGRKVKFSEFCKKYLNWAWSSKPASADREQQRLIKIQAFFQDLGIIQLDEITPYHIEQLRTKLNDDGLSKATVNRYLQILRGLFYKAIDWEAYNKPNPLKKIKFYKENPTVNPLTEDQAEKIICAAEEISREYRSSLQKSFHDICMLAVNTGLRKSEILNLKWKDFRGNEISVNGKGDKNRCIPLNLEAKAIIIKQPRKTEWVFDIPNRHQASLFKRTVGQIKKRTGIDFHFHLLRHHFTTKLIEKGIDFITISELLGHSKTTTTLIYSHTNRDRKERAVKALE